MKNSAYIFIPSIVHPKSIQNIACCQQHPRLEIPIHALKHISYIKEYLSLLNLYHPCLKYDLPISCKFNIHVAYFVQIKKPKISIEISTIQITGRPQNNNLNELKRRLDLFFILL